MKYSEAKRGRTFIIRLEDGDILDKTIERFAEDHGIKAASLIAVGDADGGSRLVVGPAESRAEVITPMEHVLPDTYEIAGTGTLFPNEAGKPMLHMHLACGRETDTITGCARIEVKAWHVIEVILQELTHTEARRLKDDATGFELLVP
jgi:predicted DNA-binding protein with PD1-like motif